MITVHQVSSTASLLLSSAYMAVLTAYQLYSAYGDLTLNLHCQRHGLSNLVRLQRRFNMEVDLQSLCHVMCTAVLIG